MSEADTGAQTASPKIEVLFDAETIATRNRALADEIVAAKPEKLVVIAVLKGSFVFAADLIRAMHDAGLAPEVEFITLSSYRDSQVSAGYVTVLRDIDSEVKGRDVLLIDDILESGRTLAFAKDLLAARGARRVMVCVLLEKSHKRAVQIEADFVGFKCPDYFVVGYGMDVAHAYRQLPFIGHIPQTEG
ncbi:hypoxanthine phosphoribosyltransferase [Ancylobacter sonchi]|uniref:hypoxanthine phosphoribosyltransferase n=1 Tax=Ancylobacter sonchi TaxID=1937790 RepID=UPI001BD58C4A|nr:hypoxanthine phosphoribosyltransferase [Ancylobacter sonchi]MBS7533880.1 hypoxanthine phosphoribosyltransferase [Ancylobacter sonchi]